VQCLSRPRSKKSYARGMRHERHIRSVAGVVTTAPRPPGRISDCKSQVQTTETMLAHVVHRQSHQDCKILAPLLSSLTSSTPQQHGKARFAASKHRCYIRRIASQRLAHDSPFARRNMLLCIFSRGLSIRTRNMLSPLSLLGVDTH
jgi:hypothetical protein